MTVIVNKYCGFFSYEILNDNLMRMKLVAFVRSTNQRVGMLVEISFTKYGYYVNIVSNQVII